MFPIIEHINQVYEAIRGRPEFICANRDTHLIFNYNVSFEDTFPEPDTKDENLNNLYRIRRECRGLIFCSKTGKVIRRPFHKFFYINERNSTSADKIDLTKQHHILEKLDGSFISPYRTHDNKFLVGTKMGVTDIANMSLKFFEDNSPHRELSEYCIENNMTPIFEFTTRKQRIVIDYGNEDRLTLLAIRHNITGEYIKY